MSNIVDSVRRNISKEGNCELSSLVINSGLAELFEQRQKILSEMNVAKQQAIVAVENLYKERLDEIDKMYAMMLTMISDNNV